MTAPPDLLLPAYPALPARPPFRLYLPYLPYLAHQPYPPACHFANTSAIGVILTLSAAMFSFSAPIT